MSYSGYTNYNYKKEEELAISLKKALSLEESAPKQKHVRACILYTWDVKGPGVLWHAIRGYQMISENIVVFKALIIFHKVIREGHPNVLKDACNDAVWVDQITRDAVGSRKFRLTKNIKPSCKSMFLTYNANWSFIVTILTFLETLIMKNMFP
jgi:huntingtin-interacting protein 1-related protein